MKEIISIKQAANLIKEGSSIMIGGFLRCGTPYKTINEIVEWASKMQKIFKELNFNI